MKKKIIEYVIILVLSIILNLNFLSSVFLSYINPENYFFGNKLVGTNAIIYSLTGGFSGLIIVFYLFKIRSVGIILSLVYFGYFFIESLITNQSLGFGFEISPLSKAGLALSIVLLIFWKVVR